MKRFALTFLLALVAIAGVAHAAEPTLVAYQESTWTDTGGGGSATETVGGAITFLTGDRIYAVGATENSANPIATPTCTGLTFSQTTTTGGGSNTYTSLWSATAGSGGSCTPSATHDGGIAGGLSAFQFRGSDGIGTPVTLTGSASKTVSLTRAQANSHVICVLADWNQVGDATTDPTPATNATEREEALVTGRADFFVYSWGDQSGTGSTSYGVTNHTGTVDLSAICVEVKGSAAAAATVSAATPSGTLGTQTTATLGATTDQNSGTFYSVVGTGSQLTGVSASQIKAGQQASGSAAFKSCNGSVSTTSPSCGVTGLSAATSYTYASIQNNTNGDSNQVTGTFTTANETLPTISSVGLIQSGKAFTIAGADFAGSSNTVRLCPTDDPAGGSCVTQTAGSESTTSITVTAASLPMGSDPGDPLRAFVNGGAGYNATGFATLVADPALCVESSGGSALFRDRSTGDPVTETDVRAIVLSIEGAAAITLEDDLDITSGVLACLVDDDFSIDELGDDYLIVFPAGGGAAAATVVDRN